MRVAVPRPVEDDAGHSGLAGLKVLELAAGIAGPYAGRLLAMLGASVVKVEPPGGDPARRLAIDDRPVANPSPIFVHLNAGKEVRPADGIDDLVSWADVILDDGVRTARVGTPLDPERLRDEGKVVVSTTAWGYDAADAGSPADELLVQAASGMVPATMEDGRPYRFPGWQSQYLAGAFSAAGALTALASGSGHHVDVSWVGSVLTGVEAGICAFLHGADHPRPPTGERDRQAGFQVGAFPAGVFRCGDGHVIPGTVRPVDWELQCQVYGRTDLLDDDRFDARQRFAHREQLRAELQPWYDAHRKYEIFESALEVGWACGMVMTAGDALTDRHLAARGFLGPVAAEATAPVQAWRVSVGRTRGDATGAEVVASDGTARASPRPPVLGDLKVLELTWAWAGPFVGRYLGAFGADVVRVEAGRYPDGWRTRLKWKYAGVDVPEGVDPDDFTWDAAALHNSLNRNKRSLSLDLTRPEGKAVFLELLDRADLLVLNMSYRMLADRDIEDEVLARVEQGLVVLNMPALGATGPYRDMPGYGILMEGMGGFAARYGTRDEAARSTNTYYPDLVAGIHGTVAALAALAARRSTGAGRLVDVSQQEVTWLQFAEAIVLRSTEGREPDRLGDAEPGCAPSGYYPTGDGRWVAILVADDEEFAALVRAASPHLDDLAELRRHQRCARRDELDAALAAWTSSRSTDEIDVALAVGPVRTQRGRTYREVYDGEDLARRGLLERIDHRVTGSRPYLALPVRIDGAPWRSRRPAPCFAEHTDEVLAEWLGKDGSMLTELRRSAVIGTVPTVAPRRAAGDG